MKDNRFYSGNYARENERFYICFTQTKSYDITTRKTRPNFTAGKMIVVTSTKRACKTASFYRMSKESFE